MVSKKFDSIKGVILSDNKGNKCCRYYNHPEEYSIVSFGDVLFEIDPIEKKINSCNAKYVVRNSNGMVEIRYCDAKKNHNFKPCTNTFYGRGLPNDMKLSKALYNKSVYGLIATNMNDAIERLGKINEEHYLGALKNGDKLYVVDKVNKIVIEETVENVSNNAKEGYPYKITINTTNFEFACYHSKYEENASKFSDPYFYAKCRTEWFDNTKISIHLDKTVADKALREYLNSRKTAEKKKEKEKTQKIPKGTPIRHCDNKNNKLHYGDKVAYVRRDCYGHTDISYGVIVGDSEKKIKVFDQVEYEDIKNYNTERGRETQPNEGVHLLERVNVLLMELAK